MRHRFVHARKAEGFPVLAACSVAGVSTSSYYDWLAKVTAGPSPAEWDEALVINEMLEIHAHHDDTYGSPRMTAELRRRGYCVNHKRTEALMRQNGIVARDGRRKKVRTTIPDVSAPPLPDRVKRDFAVGAPGLRTCGDITYIRTGEGWCYLLVTWNQTAGLNGPPASHELRGRRRLGGPTGGEVAGPRPSRTGRYLVADLVRSRPGAATDRRLCARAC